MHFDPWLLCSCFLLVLQAVLGLDKQLTCGVCRAIVDEVHHSISQVDPKKRVQVGSYRVDSRGNQNTHEKPYARSEIHLMETLEKICEKFRDYAEMPNAAGHKTVVRTSSRSGRGVSLKDVKISAEKQKLFKFKCEHLIEDYEDDMITVFRKEGLSEEEVENSICGEIADVCSEEELNVPMPSVEIDESGFEEAVKVGEEEGEEGEEENKSDDTNESVPDDPELLEEYIKDNLRGDNIVTDSQKEEL